MYKKITFFLLLSISIISSCVKQKTLVPSLQETSVQKENNISPQASESIKTVIKTVEVLTNKLAKAKLMIAEINNLSDKMLIDKGIFTNNELASLNTKINSSFIQIKGEFGKN